MPYKLKSEAPENWQKIKDVELTLGQVNHIALIYDALVKDNHSKESASRIAVSQFQRLYKKEDGEWVQLEMEPMGTTLIFNGDFDNAEKIEMGVYQKEILRTGDYAHPQIPTRRFVVTKDRIKKWIANFKAKIVDFVPVPITDKTGHKTSSDPGMNKGEVTEVFSRDNADGSTSFMGKVNIDEDTSKLVDNKKLRGVSASISPNYLDKFGKNVGDVFTHLLLTNTPYMTGTAPFKPILNSKEEIIGSTINLSRECAVDMSAVTYQQYPIAEGMWDSWEARERIKKWASSDKSGDSNKVDFSKYMQGFAYVNLDNKENFSSYRLVHHDIDNGNMKTYIGGIIAVSNDMARGSLSYLIRNGIPLNDIIEVQEHINKHREEFDLLPLQFDGSEKELESVKMEMEKYGAGNPENAGNKNDSEVNEMKEKELEVQLNKANQEKADLEKKTADLEARETQLNKDKADLEAKNKILTDVQLEANKKDDEALVERLLGDGKITEAHKKGILVLMENGRNTAIEMEIEDGKKETKSSRDILVSFLNDLPKAIDYSVAGVKADGKPESADANLEAEGVKAGQKVRGEVEKK